EGRGVRPGGERRRRPRDGAAARAPPGRRGRGRPADARRAHDHRPRPHPRPGGRDARGGPAGRRDARRSRAALARRGADVPVEEPEYAVRRVGDDGTRGRGAGRRAARVRRPARGGRAARNGGGERGERVSRERTALLALADGTVFRGRAFGAVGEAGGELVFNTSMTGYQEILTDPSYEGQLVAMTYPEIGNVGVNREDVESRRPFVRGFVVREYRDVPSSWRAEESLGAYLARHGIPGIEGIDTRALVRHLRDHGSQEAVLSSADLDADRLVAKATAAPGLVGRDLVREVTCAAPYDWTQGPWKLGGYLTADEISAVLGRPAFKVVAYDYGIKYNILRNLVGSGCAVRVVPASTPALDVLALRPDGVFLSNGPGDPDAVPGAPENVAQLLGEVPVFGICLGHQILGL